MQQFAVAFVALTTACGRERPHESTAAAANAASEVAPHTGYAPTTIGGAFGPFCTEGWSALDEGTCFYVPPTLVSPATVLFFVHGIMSADASPAEAQARVRRVAEERGAVAMFPRGRQGLCTWDVRMADSWCWPTRRETVDAFGPPIIDDWADAQALVERIVGVSFERRYVVGFSNGGYFVAYLALEGAVGANGFAVVGAGRSAIDDARVGRTPTPTYIAVGDQEVPSTILGAENMGAYLFARAWPSKFVIHTTRGHEIRDDDFDAAWQLWTDR